MLLFQKRFHEGLVRGEIRLTVRCWQKPHVRVGGRYRCHPIGVLEVDRVDRVPVARITAKDARLAGFASRAELVEYLRSGPAPDLDEKTEVFRVELHHAGDGDRVELAMNDELGPEDVRELTRRLERLDAKGAWSLETLRLIRNRPRVAASRLAAELGRETQPFKVDVRKLKKLGLTQSFEVGYELSPRGSAYLSAIRRRRRPA